jgi:hypothetical protein
LASWYFFSAIGKYRSVFLVAQIYLFFNGLSKYCPATFSINISHCRLAILFFSSLRWFSNIPLLAANGWLYECAAVRWLCALAFGRHFRKAVVGYILKYSKYS